MLAEAGLGLLSAVIALRTLPFRYTARLAGLSPGAEASAASLGQLERAERVGWAVRRVAGRTPWMGTCLVQAVAGAVLLRRRRIPANVSFGVARDGAASDGWTAHAWLSCAGRVLIGDGPQRARCAVVGVYSSRPDRQP